MYLVEEPSYMVERYVTVCYEQTGVFRKERMSKLFAAVTESLQDQEARKKFCSEMKLFVIRKNSLYKYPQWQMRDQLRESVSDKCEMI